MLFALFIIQVFLCQCLSIVASKLLDQKVVPVVGILVSDTLPQEGKISYLPASYVKYFESAGARVVPILLNQSDEYYHKMFKSTNGIVFPGGIDNITTIKFGRVPQFFINQSIEVMDKEGEIYPVIGICQGFEVLMYYLNGEDNATLTTTGPIAVKVTRPINYTKDAASSRLFHSLPANVLYDLGHYNLTAHSHHFSVLTKTFYSSVKLQSIFKTTATNTFGDFEIVSMVEGKRYPFYGIQWHPEKNCFEFDATYVNHSEKGKIATKYIANFFVEEMKRSTHSFATKEEMDKSLIDNYCPQFSPGSYFTDTYYF